MKIVFFGSGEYTIPVIQMLQDHGLELVVTTELEGKFYEFLKSNNIPFLSTHLNNKEDRQKIKDLDAEIGILASYGAFVPNRIIEAFPLGILNIHPSLLPIYKGPSPVQYAIKNGDTKTGVTIIKLDDQIDHGPILSQQEYDLKGNETLEDLKKVLFKIGSDMIEKILVKYETSQLVEMHDQDHAKEVFTYKISREDGKIDLNNIPTNLDNIVRAYYPWPGVWFETEFMGKMKRFKLLPGKKIQMEGKSIMSYKDFLNGYGSEGNRIISLLQKNP